MWLISWRGQLHVWEAAVASLLTGLLFGLMMAAYYRNGRRKYALPRWESLGNGRRG